MKKYILFLVILSAAVGAKSQDFVIADFENSQKISYMTSSGGGQEANSSAIVMDDPAGGDNKALRVLIKNSNTYPEFAVTLPEGTKLGDYQALSVDVFRIDKGDGTNFQLYLGDWAEGSSPSRWSAGKYLRFNTNRDSQMSYYEWKTIVINFADWATSGNGGNAEGVYSEDDKKLTKFRLKTGIGSGNVRYFLKNLKFIK